MNALTTLAPFTLPLWGRVGSRRIGRDGATRWRPGVGTSTAPHKGEGSAGIVLASRRPTLQEGEARMLTYIVRRMRRDHPA